LDHLKYYKETDLLDLVEDIIDLDPKMRFVAIINKKGNIVESIMKSGKTSLKTQKEEEHFCKQVAQRRKMRHEFDKHLGKVRYVHVEREKLTQLVVYTKNKTIYFTVEPELSINKKLQLIMKIKKLSSHL
jgi:deoxycytidylate deaminase